MQASICQPQGLCTPRSLCVPSRTPQSCPHPCDSLPHVMSGLFTYLSRPTLLPLPNVSVTKLGLGLAHPFISMPGAKLAHSGAAAHLCSRSGGAARSEGSARLVPFPQLPRGEPASSADTLPSLHSTSGLRVCQTGRAVPRAPRAPRAELRFCDSTGCLSREPGRPPGGGPGPSHR